MYSSPEVCALTGITARQLLFWQERGYVSPSNNARKNQRREWSEQDVRLVGRIAELVKEGYRVEVAAVKAREEMVTNG